MGQAIPLLGGAYTAASLIANAQRCVNLYPEKNQGDSPYPVTHYPTPGLVSLVQDPLGGRVRGLYRSTRENVPANLWAVIDSRVFLVDPSWKLLQVGTIPSKSTPVKMVDNGNVLIIVDGGPVAWQVTLGTNQFSTLNDPTGAFVGSSFVEFLDTFLLFNWPQTPTFFSSLSNTVQFDPLYFAAKTGSTDPIQGIAVVHREIWLIGSLTTEVWYDAGNAAFPFAELPGAYIEHGCLAPYSIAKADLSVFWLGQDRQGQCMVFQGADYKAKRISTHAIEHEFQGYATLSDAIGFTYQQQGHIFYVLTFPQADKTWCYDMSTGMWHERAWMDALGGFHRVRYDCHAFAYGTNVVGDFQNGTLYQLSTEVYDDVGSPIPRLRSFPHIVVNGNRARHQQFLADVDGGEPASTTSLIALEVGGVIEMESGGKISTEQGQTIVRPPFLNLRWSDSRGHSWGNYVPRSFGNLGEFKTQPQWRRLGIARDRVYELSWSSSMKTALNGAYLVVEELPT